MGCGFALGSGVGDRVGNFDLYEFGFFVRIDRNEVVHFTVDPALAVTGNHRKEVGFYHGSIRKRTSPLGSAPAHEWFSCDRKNGNPVDEVLRAAIGSA
jgi:hypothetical protein